METLTKSHGLSWIAVKIFRTLEYDDLQNCRKVSKYWRKIIDTDVQIWRIQLRQLYKCLKRIDPTMRIASNDHLLYASGVGTSEWKPKGVLFQFHPDLQEIFDQALKQNAKIIKKFCSCFKVYHESFLDPERSTDSDPLHPMQFAADTGNITFMKLLNKYCHVDYELDADSQTMPPILFACRSSQFEAIRFLLPRIRESEISFCFNALSDFPNIHKFIDVLQVFVNAAIGQISH